jgi:hypothetical protein
MSTIELTSAQCSQRFSSVLKVWVSGIRGSRKKIASAIGAHPRVVKNYVEGTGNIPVDKLLKLMAICPPLVDEVLEMVKDLEADNRKAKATIDSFSINR